MMKLKKASKTYLALAMLMGSTNQVLDKIPEKKRGIGAIICLIDKKTYLRENLVALPIEYI